MKTDHLKTVVAVVAAMVLTCFSAQAAETANVRHVPGEITWVDLKLGKLQLEMDGSPSAGKLTEYRITAQETRVTDPADKKLLTVTDLQPGQHVVIDVIDAKEEMIVQKITVDPRSTPDLQEAYGEVDAINGEGTFALMGRASTLDAQKPKPVPFVFDPKKLLVMQSPSRLPVQVMVKTGDTVKVEFVVKDGKRWAHSVTLYAPRTVNTTTTTTVVTTNQ